MLQCSDAYRQDFYYCSAQLHLPHDTSARVTDIHGGQGIRRNLNQLGIHIGDIVSIVRSGAFRGPLLLRVHGMQVALGRGVAHHVTVARLGRPESEGGPHAPDTES